MPDLLCACTALPSYAQSVQMLDTWPRRCATMLVGCGRGREGEYLSWLPELTCFPWCMQILSKLSLCALPGSLELNQQMADEFTAKVGLRCATTNRPIRSICDSHSGGKAPRSQFSLSNWTFDCRPTSS